MWLTYDISWLISWANIVKKRNEQIQEPLAVTGTIKIGGLLLTDRCQNDASAVKDVLIVYL